MEHISGPEKIRKAVEAYNLAENKKEAGIALVLTVRNGIEPFCGNTAEEMYMDTAAFKKLLYVARSV